MTDFIVKTPAQVWDELNPQPSQSVIAAEWNDGSDWQAYQYTTDDVDPLPAWPALTEVWGAFDRDTGVQLGDPTPTYPIPAEYWTRVNVLGNDAGRATGPLRIVKWQGHSEQKYAVADTNEYPVGNEPFILQIQRQDYGSTALPWDTNTVYETGDFATSGGMWRSLQDGNQGNTPFGGSPFWEFINQPGPWGWVVFIISDDPTRDKLNRAISQHTAEPCNDGNFLFTTGEFINDGKYGDVFYTECPIDQRKANNEDVPFALRFGAGYEGYFTLPAGGVDTDGLFWAADAP